MPCRALIFIVGGGAIRLDGELAQAHMELIRCKIRNIRGIRIYRVYGDQQHRGALVEHDLNGRSCIIASSFDLGSVAEPKVAPDWSTPTD